MRDEHAGPARTILLVEDDPSEARLIREMLRDARGGRFRLECEDRLTAGLERLKRGGVDLVLLDLSLSESRGIEPLLRVREQDAGIPIVVLTGSIDEDLGDRAVKSGAQDYLMKAQVQGPLLERSLSYAIERGRIDQELRRRAAEIAAMDRRKDEFLATLAHELRNPLMPLRNALHLLMRRADGRSAEQLYEMMERQLDNLVRLVDELIEASRITQGRIDLRREPVDVATILKNAVEMSRPLLEKARHRIELKLPDEPLRLDADALRITQVIANLLDNAAKYTNEGGEIRLSAAREGLEAVISVRDTGMGIAPEMLPRVFDMFAQVDRTLHRSQGGLGIGLMLARTLIEMHGGRIEARSEGLGRGSEFIVRLPLSAKSDALPPPPEAGKPDRQPGLSGRRVLVVDDNRDSADSLGMVLRAFGAETRVAYGGRKALEAMRAERPDVVLLDIGMPEMDGYDVARQIRQDPQLFGVTLIALTGWGQDDDRRRSLDAGFDHHLVKPVDASILHALLARPSKS